MSKQMESINSTSAKQRVCTLTTNFCNVVLSVSCFAFISMPNSKILINITYCPQIKIPWHKERASWASDRDREREGRRAWLTRQHMR